MIRHKSVHNPRVSAAVAAITAIVFGIDYLTPVGYAEWVLYMVPVALCVLQNKESLGFIAASVNTLLIIIGLLVSPSGVISTSVSMLNRGFAVFAMFCLAWMAHEAIRERLKARRLFWLQQGQSGNAMSMIGELSPSQLGANFLRHAATYLDAQVGLLYRLDKGRLIRTSSYACAVPDEEESIPLASAGMAGEVAQSGKAMILSQVPGSYLRFSSLSGSAAPASVLIAPVTIEGRVVGVFELGFARARGNYGDELEFVSLIVNGAGLAMRAALYREHLRELLEETQRQSEELQTQQEELRVSNEELQEQDKVLRESQSRLEQQQAELEQTNVQLEEQAQRLQLQKQELLQAHRHLEERSADLEKASQYKSEFLANMSHELRTPLNSSLILSQILGENRSGGLTGEEIRYARTIHAANSDLLTLINDILDLSKIEAGHANIEPGPVPVPGVMEAMHLAFDALAAEKGLTFEIRVDPSAPPKLFTDNLRLQQILKNLLSNAFKFTEKGGVTLSVAGGRDESGQARVWFSVSDTGIGIAAAQQQVIFDAFRQADGSTSRKYGGTGLGLSISRELARLLGGGIRVDSTVGLGSTFTLEIAGHLVVEAEPDERNALVPATELPLRQRPASPPAARSSVQHEEANQPFPAATAPAPAAESRLVRRFERLILVIEDDPHFAAVLEETALALEFDCLVTSLGEQAIRLAREHRPSGILLDVGLPDQSGLSVLESLKRDPLTRHIPVHMISANDHAQTALALGAVGYALKPVKHEELVAAISRLEAQLQSRARRVLVVEDDATLRENIRLLLNADDIEISTAGTIAEALALLELTTFDCMVMDLALPDGTGFELLEQMSEKQSFPPVIVYTGRALSRQEEAQLQRYSKSIIIKGAKSPERLLDEVSLFLHRVVETLPQDQQRLLSQARQRDALFEGRRILLAEDDVRNIFALSSIFEPLGAQLIIARNGLEALQQLERQADIDLVLMDLMMPEMDGLTAMRELRKRPQWSRLPVIALTAKAMADDRRNCLEAGANDYIAKPIDVDKLVSLCRVWMPK
jgi:CheY-like chemotaxis protein/signal transduction histidine kinase